MKKSVTTHKATECKVSIKKHWFVLYSLTKNQPFTYAKIYTKKNKKAQLSLTNPRDAKACQKLLQFDVLTTLSLTILR